MKICYFTATGNSLYVARKIGGNLLSIPQLIKKPVAISDEAVGIVCPTYGGEMPLMVREFMMKAEISTDYFFFVYTYGQLYSYAFEHAEDIARTRGWDLKYISAVQMVDNYLPIFDMQEQMDTLPQKDVDGQLAKLCRDIEARREKRVTITPDSQEQMIKFRDKYAIPFISKDKAKEYIANENCIHCGICAKVCPANNITVTKNKVIFSNRCEVCYACLHSCPQNALHLAAEKSLVRFRNEHITLKNIIAANNQAQQSATHDK